MISSRETRHSQPEERLWVGTVSWVSEIHCCMCPYTLCVGLRFVFSGESIVNFKGLRGIHDAVYQHGGFLRMRSDSSALDVLPSVLWFSPSFHRLDEGVNQLSQLLRGFGGEMVIRILDKHELDVFPVRNPQVLPRRRRSPHISRIGIVVLLRNS